MRTTGLCSGTWWDGDAADCELMRRMAVRAPYRVRTGLRLEVSGPTCLAKLGVADEPTSHRGGEANRSTLPPDRFLVGFHGRLDNPREVAHSLGREPIGRSGDEDEETLLKFAYLRWGVRMLAHLLGDFAFVLWDAERRRLVAGRDSMGMKPLYFTTDGERTLIASEIRQILAADGTARRLWEPAVCAYLGGGEIPADRSFYDGVMQIPPGSALVVDGGKEEIVRCVDVLSRLPEKSSGGDLEERFRETFRMAVGRRVRGASSVGVALSGGLDSGSIASMLGVLQDDGGRIPEVHTYSWAFPSLTECDEREVSRKIVEAFGFPHQDLDAEAAHPLSGYPAHGPHEDDPLIFPYQAILERTFTAAASDGVDVLMSGDRGDLLTGDFVYDLPSEFANGHPLRAIRGLATLRQRSGAGWAGGAWRHFVRPTLSSAKATWRRVRGTGPDGTRGPNPTCWPDWVRADFLERVSPPTPDPWPSGVGWLDPARRRRVQRITSNFHMRGVVATERCHASRGLDFADPWSDVELARLCIAADQNVLNHPGEEKRLVRSAMRGVIPEAARTACCKTIPLPLYRTALRVWQAGTVRSLLDQPRVAAMGFVDRDVLAGRFEEFVSGAEPRWEFWWTLSLEMWLRRYW